LTHASIDNRAPIGVFDSGLGGLTVARRIMEALPHERILYVADQANVPYGGRDLTEVCGFACGISQALIESGCKAVVMACNISSATALQSVQDEFSQLPVLGVIRPGAEAAAKETKNGRIGVLATAGTVKSGAYTQTLHDYHAELFVLEVPCPLFVPLVEDGTLETLEALAAAETYLAPLLAADVDTVILGCTHYPFLLPALRSVAPHLCFVDPAYQTVQQLTAQLEERELLTSPSPAPPYHLLTTTGSLDAYASQLHRFLPAADNANLASAHWQERKLILPTPL
jgi:glutamate racemase